MQGKKFISPGAWFSMIYPGNWNEFEDTESSFLFYNPTQWSGNFRISSYKKMDKKTSMIPFGEEFTQDELKNNESSTLIKIGKLICAYSKEMFQEDGVYYVNHLWVTGIDNIAFECSFTTHRDSSLNEAEDIISSLEIRKEEEKYPPEIIPARILEITEINESYDWVVSEVKKQLKKDFQGAENDLMIIQKIIDSGVYPPKKKEAWLALGIAICVIIANEIDKFEWMTLIDGNREAPVLQYDNNPQIIIDPMNLVWSKIKRSQPCDVVAEYKRIIESL